MPKNGKTVPAGQAPVTTQAQGPDKSTLVQVRCPNSHAAGNGYVAEGYLGDAICVTGSEVLVPVTALARSV